MILIKTKVEKSTIHGIGLFADQFIAKGTPTWRYDPRFDKSYTQDDIDHMSEPAQKIFLWYAYFDFDQNKYILCFDDQRFINHSKKQGNIESTPNEDIALRDIQPGEELLCDYTKFDKGYWKRHNVDEATLE